MKAIHLATHICLVPQYCRYFTVQCVNLPPFIRKIASTTENRVSRSIIGIEKYDWYREVMIGYREVMIVENLNRPRFEGGEALLKV